MTSLITLSPALTRSTTLVVLAAGRGQRFGRDDAPKHLARVRGVPLVVRLVKQLSGSFANPPVVVINQTDVRTVAVFDKWNVTVRSVCQVGGPGTVPALLDALPYCGENLCVVLGDSILAGRVVEALDVQPAIVVWPDGTESAVHANYGVDVKGRKVMRVIEKPKAASGLLCGVGLYLLGSDVIRTFAHDVIEDSRGERGVTDLLSAVIAGGVEVSAAKFEGLYVNVNQRMDLLRAERALPQE